MKTDLTRLAQRLTAAAERTAGYEVTATSTELVISKDGHGTGRSESIAYGALFLREDDVLAQALDRLERGFPQAA